MKISFQHNYMIGKLAVKLYFFEKCEQTTKTDGHLTIDMLIPLSIPRVK